MGIPSAGAPAIARYYFLRIQKNYRLRGLKWINMVLTGTSIWFNLLLIHGSCEFKGNHGYLNIKFMDPFPLGKNHGLKIHGS